MWPNVADGGWSCDPCKQTVQPTWDAVVWKAWDRIRAGKPISLANEDYRTIADRLNAADLPEPVRFGDEQAWTSFRSELIGVFEPIAADTTIPALHGLILDALDYGFPPNLQTNAFLALARMVEDRQLLDPWWTEVFVQRKIVFAHR